jgi:hypothetical protein
MMVKYFFLRGQGSKVIHKELVSTFHNNAISLSAVKNWLRGFKSGDLSCGDNERSGRHLISLGFRSSALAEEVSFVSARVMTGHFSVDRAASKSSLDRELGLRNFTGRWVPHILSAEHNLRRVTESLSLLTILANLVEKNFQGIITGDESWFADLIESDVMFASSPAEVTQGSDDQFRAKSDNSTFF